MGRVFVQLRARRCKIRAKHTGLNRKSFHRGGPLSRTWLGNPKLGNFLNATHATRNQSELTRERPQVLLSFGWDMFHSVSGAVGAQGALRSTSWARPPLLPAATGRRRRRGPHLPEWPLPAAVASSTVVRLAKPRTLLYQETPRQYKASPPSSLGWSATASHTAMVSRLFLFWILGTAGFKMNISKFRTNLPKLRTCDPPHVRKRQALPSRGVCAVRQVCGGHAQPPAGFGGMQLGAPRRCRRSERNCPSRASTGRS